MNWNRFAQDVHQVAVANGLWDKPPSFAEFIVDCHADLSKAAEAYRDGKPMVYRVCVPSNGEPCWWDCGKPCPISTGELTCDHRGTKPEGVAAHLADCILRIMDYVVGDGVDFYVMHVYARENFLRAIDFCHNQVSLASIKMNEAIGDRPYSDYLIFCVSVILRWAKAHNVDMKTVIQAKHAYNRSRIRPNRGDKPKEVTP